MYIIIYRHGEEEKFIGTFQDKDYVNEVIERYKQFEGFNKYKDGFIVLEPPYRGKDILQKKRCCLYSCILRVGLFHLG